jgi:hypothetical protein
MSDNECAQCGEGLFGPTKSTGAADGLFDAFLSGSFTAPAQRRLNRNCVKYGLTEQDNGLNMSAWYRVD